MGNVVSLAACGQSISMSNGLTSVFISTLGLSGTHLARADPEKRLIVRLLEKDQSAVGGTVGFDLCDMPWDCTVFEETKQFLLDVIDGAKRKIGWEYLGYSPNEALLFPCLDRFHQLAACLQKEMLRPASAQKWLPGPAGMPRGPAACSYPCCQKHPVFLTGFGCFLCNN